MRTSALLLCAAAALPLTLPGCGTGRRPDGARPEATPLYHELAAKPPELRDAIQRSHPFLLRRDEKGVLRASTPLFASLDESPPWIGVTDGFRSDTGLTGSGVIIGIVDTGIDWSHPDFLGGEDGGTRILYILDYMLPAQMPDLHPEVDHGIYRIYGKAEIDSALAAVAQGQEPEYPIESMDLMGHGTHVASIAAGSDTSGPYTGIAPGALLVVVKAIRREGLRFEDFDVGEAAGFIFSVCDLYGLPCVVNLSLGGHMGGHDGSSELERSIEEKLGEKPGGRVVVAAAGNQGGQSVHALADLRQGEEETVGLTVPDNSPAVEGGAARIVLDAWARGPGGADADVTASVRTPSSAVIEAGPGRLVEEIVDGTWVTVSNSPSGPDPYNGDRETIITLTGDPGHEGKVSTGLYQLTLRGEGSVDLYLAQVDMRTGLWGTPFLSGDTVVATGSVDIPATSRSVLAVGAITVKTSWTGPGGVLVAYGGAVIASRAGFSSLGPARDGAIKPEFLAPGEWIAAALSSSADEQDGDAIFHGLDPDMVLTPDGAHIHTRGTSNAAPHLSGLAALMLEADPALSQGEISAALIFSALDDDSAENAPAITGRGYGLPDAAKAIRIVQGELGQVVNLEKSMVITSSLNYAPGLSRDLEVYVLPMDDRSMPVEREPEIEIQPTDCSMAQEIEALPGGIYRQTWSCGAQQAPPPGRTIYFIVSVDGLTLGHVGSVEITSGRIDLEPQFESSGGCSAGP